MSQKTRHWAALRAGAALLVLSACTEAVPPLPPPTPTTEPAPPPAPVLAPAPAPTPVAVEPPATLTPADGPFHLVAYREDDFLLRRLDDRLGVLAGADLTLIDGHGALTPVAGSLAGDLDGDQLDYHWRTRTFGGRWPDQAWLVADATLTRVANVPRVYRRTADEWRLVDNRLGEERRPDFWYYREIVPWHKGQVVGLRISIANPDVEYWEEVDAENDPERPPPSGPIPQAARLDLLGDPIQPLPHKIARDLRVVAAAAAGNGDLYLLARRGDRREVSLIQRWEPGGRPAGTVHTFPRSVRLDHLLIGTDGSVRVAGIEGDGIYLARRDGNTWPKEPVHSGREVRALALTTDGDLWLVAHHDVDDEHLITTHLPTSLHRRRAGQSDWEPIALPEVRLPATAWWQHDTFHPERRQHAPPRSSAKPLDVLAGLDGDVWITVGLGGHETDGRTYPDDFALLHDRPAAGPPLRLRGGEEQHAAFYHDRSTAAERSEPRCTHPYLAFAVLKDLPPGTADDAPVPAVAAFLRANAGVVAELEGIYELELDGKRVIAVVPKRTGGPNVLAALDRADPDVQHGFQCRLPPVRRGFDLTDGKPLP